MSFNFTDCTPEESCPLKVFGLPPFYDGEGFSRCHNSILEKIPRVRGLGKRSGGGRICFRTDAPELICRMTLSSVGLDLGISMFGGSSAAVFSGPRENPLMIGLVNPGSYSEGEVTAEGKMSREFIGYDGSFKDITVFLPRNETVVGFSVGVEEGYSILPPTPYRNERPVAFYGSSITEGGCPSSGPSSYVSHVSNLLNLDVVNYGFSGSAQGDLNFADYIVSRNPPAVVYDYDFNAPDEEWLSKTHEPFYRRLREGLPDAPIIMMSRPDFTLSEESKKRREIILRTYAHAIADGDTNVRFIDGRAIFPNEARPYCNVDCCHPNDLGFYFMTCAVAPVLKEVLGID